MIFKTSQLIKLHLLFLIWNSLFSVPLLNDLDFTKGNWELVAVSLLNYYPVPLQKELGTFIIRDTSTLLYFQRTWDLEPYYADYCEHHYALKFYRNRKLIKTFKLNLHCGYITTGDGIFSYKFNPQEFLKFRHAFQKIPWSLIRYKSLKSLRLALQLIQQQDNLYLYDDYTKYQYNGLFVFAVDNQPWYVNRDSLYQAVVQKIARITQSRQFHVEQYIFYLTKEMKLNFRYFIYCNYDLFQKYAKKQQDFLIPWRSHLQHEGGELKIMVIGINEKGYWQLFSNYTPRSPQ